MTCFAESVGGLVVEAVAADSLARLLELRGDPMRAAVESPWVARFGDIPGDASVPLAMSGPHPLAVGSYGAECIEWARVELGLTLRWWQALAVTRQLEHDADGALVWREIVESGPRRIGKSVRLRVVALWRLVNAERFRETQLAMLVSKDLAVGKEIHRGAWRWADAKGWNVLRLNGAQEVETPTGSRWLLRAPNAAYGYDVGYGQVDESWGVDPQAITDGLEPALLERESPQLHLTSTAHVRASSLMRRRLTAALRNADRDVLLLLWGAHPDADVADPATWRTASPHWTEDRQQLVARKYAAALAGQDEPEFDDPDPIRGWAAQYLNVWPLLIGRSGGLFPNWDALATDSPAPPVSALGVAADLDQAWYSLGACGGDDGGRHLGSVLRVRAASEAEFVAEAKRIQDTYQVDVVIDGKGPAESLIPALEAGGVRLRKISLDEFVQACADISKAVEQGTVTHGNFPDLNAAVDAAGWRKIGAEGARRAFARKSGDIAMLEAVTLAYHGATNRSSYDVLTSVLL